MEPLVCGIDLGTGGLRALAVDLRGRVVASTTVPLARDRRTPEGHHEQDVDDWKRALLQALDPLMAELGDRVQAIACTSTSGSIAALDADGAAVGPVLMYDDGRAETSGGPQSGEPAAQAVPRLRWIAEHWPRTARCVHAVDVLNERLCGHPVATDFTSALKSGWDDGWLHAFPFALPDVVAPATSLGTLSDALRRRWGLTRAVPVVAGATDANAAFYASGARKGAWSTACGSTIAVRVASKSPVDDPQRRFYTHRRPGGGLLAAGASNAGMAGMRPGCVRYPLTGRGERLPFVSPDAVAFDVALDVAADDAAWIGLALVERWIHEEAVAIGLPAPTAVYTTGGGAYSDQGMALRARVLQVPVLRARHPDAAFGASLLAAMATMREDLDTVSRRMIEPDCQHDPDPAFRSWAVDALGRMRSAARRWTA